MSRRIVVAGGTGLIGSKLVRRLTALGHEAIAAAPDTGVNTITGAGLAEVLHGAAVVVDVSNSPSFAEQAVMEFFETSTRHLLSYAGAAGVGHYVALSVVGTDRLQESPYMRAKMAQETLIRQWGRPHTIVHATQFFEFVMRMADEATVDGTVRVPPVFLQPIAADDVAAAVARAALGTPRNGMVETAGPERLRFEEFVRRGLRAHGDPRNVAVDGTARYFGARLGELDLVASGEAEIGETRFDDWLSVGARK